MTNTFDNMTLDKAYEIAGGYIEADDATFRRALALVRKDDEEFAQALEEARIVENKLKLQEEREEELTASADGMVANSHFIEQTFNDTQFKKDFFEDEEVQEVVENTPIYDRDLETQSRYELQGEDKNKHIDMLFEKAKLDAMRQTVGDKEFSFQDVPSKRKSLFDKVKTSFFGTILHLKTASQLEDDLPESARALDKGDRNFFTKQFASMTGKLALALHLKRNVKVSADSVMAACADSEKKTSKFTKRIKDLASTADKKQKEKYEKVVKFIEKSKQELVKNAKTLWGQRYEFMANLRDRAPKIITDVSATVALVGATAASAPWIGSAIVAYGAYKATSSWVWPIITQTRKDVRLAKAANKDAKVGFWKNLQKAANKTFADKKLRNAYFREATWGTAAGLIGLGAVGVASSSGLQAAAQRSFQALGSVAVYAGNSFTNAVKTFRDKDKTSLEKGITAASAVVMTYVLYACGSNAAHAATLDTPVISDTPQPVPVTESNTDTLNADTLNDGATEFAAPAEITVPEAWNENMKISASAWARLQNFWGDRAHFEAFYQKITDDMLGDGETREEFLFKYERMSSWNLPQHRDAIAHLDNFFAGCDEATLSENDLNALSDVMPNGSIKDVEGTECLRVTGRHIECGEQSVLYAQKVDCGCDDVTVEDVSGVESAPVENTTVEETTVVEQPEQPNQLEATFGDETGSSTLEETIEVHTVFPSASLHQANGANDEGVNLGTIDPNNLGDIHPANKEILTNSSSIELEGDGFVEIPGTTTVIDANGSQTSIELEGDGFVEIPGTKTVVDANGSQTSIELEGDGFVEIPGTKTVVDANDVSQPVIPAEFDEEGSVTIVNEEVQTADVEAARTSAEAEAVINDNVTITENIVQDSPEIEPGTPAPDNHPLRGGYMDSGLSEKKYHRMEVFYKDRFGEDAFDSYMEMITDDMRAKGGVFEGLSRAESLYTVQQMIAWSNDQHGAFAEQITSVVSYLKGCDGAISEENMASIKEVIDKVRENGTIDGVIGRNGTAVKFFQAGDCGEAGTYGYTHPGANGITNPSGPKFPRFFKQFITAQSEPITIPEEFTYETGFSEEVIITEEKTVLTDPITIVKSNGVDDSGKVVGTGVSPDAVSNVTPPEKEVMVSSAKTDAVETSVSAQPEAAEQLSEAAEADLRSRGINPKDIPEVLYKYLNGKTTNR